MRDVLVKNEEFKDSPLGKIPKDWEILKIGSFASIKYGINDAIDQTLESGVPTITLPCVKRTGELVLHKDMLGLTSRHKVSTDDYLQHGDLLFNWRNGSQEHLGKTAYFDAQGEYTHVGFLLRIRTNSEVCHSRYLWWRLSYIKYQGFFLKAKSQVNNTFNSAELAAVSVIMPPLTEQNRIAEILDTVDDAIARTSSLITKLKQIKAGLLHDLLTRGLDEDGHLRDPQTHPEEFKDSPLGRIPTDWEVAPLKAKQNPSYPYIKTGPFGSSLKGEHWVDEGVPVITIGSIGEGEFLKSELLFISEAKARSLSAYAVKEGDLVFSRVADVGRSVVVSEAEDGWIMSSNLMRISLDRTLVESSFAYLNIVHNQFTRRQIREFVNSGGREIANTAVLDSMLFCWASKEEQLRITKTASIYDFRIRKEEAYLNKLKLQKQGLMHDLLTGKVRVKNTKN